MSFKKGDKVSGDYLGVYSFTGSIWHTEARSKGLHLYIELERPIFVGETLHERNHIYVSTEDDSAKLKKLLDKQ
tara:strand:+ start:909 stop:1130 length:222 start_codon:yes stop_codon:yes gene_type:complete